MKFFSFFIGKNLFLNLKFFSTLALEIIFKLKLILDSCQELTSGGY